MTLPILTPKRSLTYTPRTSDPSKTAPFLIVTPIPAPKKSPPKMEMRSLSSVIGLKFSKWIMIARATIAMIDLRTILKLRVRQAMIRKGILIPMSK